MISTSTIAKSTLKQAVAGTLIGLLAWTFHGVAAQAAPVAPNPNDPTLGAKERMEALFERVRQEQQKIETLEASFVQRRESDLFLEPEVARGTFSYSAPDHVRWEYATPNPMSVLIDGREMVTWYRDLGRAEKLKIGRYSSQAMKYLGASGSLDTLLDYFRVVVRFPDQSGGAEDGSVLDEGSDRAAFRLRLIPKYERISKRIKTMIIWVDPEMFFPTRLRMEQVDGEATDYRFLNLEVNPQIPGERFELQMPESVVTRELSLGEDSR